MKTLVRTTMIALLVFVGTALSPGCTDTSCTSDADCVGTLLCDPPAYPGCTVQSYGGEEGSCVCAQ